MKSLQIFNAVMLALAASFAVTMGAVAIMYGVYLGSEPRLQEDWPAVLAATEVFGALTLISGLAFYAHKRDTSWRWIAQTLMLGGYVGGGWILYRVLA